MVKKLDYLKIQKEIQSMIGDLRRSKKMTQEQLAQTVDIETKSVSDIETNRRKASVVTLIKIFCALDVDIGKILNRK